MRLAALLTQLRPEELERLRAEHLGDDEHVTHTSLAATLEGVLRSYAFVRKFVADRFPPTFSILETLLDSEGWSHPATTFRDVVTERTNELVARVRSGDLVRREDSLRLYRRVLLEARRNDLVIDASEAALLGVLRRELEIRSVEHFLLEHHVDFHDFWAKETAFLDEMYALRTCGLVFGHAGNIVLADEVVPLVRQTLGLEMSNASRRRLYAHLSGGELADVLGNCELKTSGSRDEKFERLVASYVQPSEVLRGLPLQLLRDICRASSASVSGSKDDLVDRLVDHYLHDLDIRPESEGPAPPVRVAEPRALDPIRFHALFASLRGDDLTDILAGIDSSRVTGAKDMKVDLIVQSELSENTLLDKLTSRALEDALARQHLRTSGSKQDRIDRYVEFYRTLPENVLDISPKTSRSPELESPSDDSSQSS